MEIECACGTPHKTHKPFVGLGERKRWINLSQAIHARSARFPWLKQRPDPLMEDMLWNGEDLLGTLVNRGV